jgi:hypothetical protein
MSVKGQIEYYVPKMIEVLQRYFSGVDEISVDWKRAQRDAEANFQAGKPVVERSKEIANLYSSKIRPLKENATEKITDYFGCIERDIAKAVNNPMSSDAASIVNALSIRSNVSQFEVDSAFENYGGNYSANRLLCDICVKHDLKTPITATAGSIAEQVSEAKRISLDSIKVYDGTFAIKGILDSATQRFVGSAGALYALEKLVKDADYISF